MKKIVCFGEALIDFLNSSQRLEEGLLLKSFDQYPGGAPANAAVAVAKLGGQAAFAGQVGNDPFGEFLVDALRLYGVDTSLTLVHPTAPTALAFVFLDDNGDRAFLFRRDATADLVINKEQIGDHWFNGDPILHFCSNTLTDQSIADVTRYVVSEARRRGAFVSFDVNLRHHLWRTGHADIATVSGLISHADIAKLSLEELDYLSGGSSTEYLAGCFESGLTMAVITNGPGKIEIHTADAHDVVMPPDVQAVDTTGGGDAFIGALLFGLGKQTDPLTCLRDLALVKRLVIFAANCGAISVTRFGAFPSFPVFAEVEERWTS